MVVACTVASKSRSVLWYDCAGRARAQQPKIGARPEKISSHLAKSGCMSLSFCACSSLFFARLALCSSYFPTRRSTR